MSKKQRHFTLLFGMAGNSDSCDTSTSTDSMIVPGSPDVPLVLDDTFLILQRATTIVKNIYFDYYALSKADFLKNVEGLGNEMEFRYARDMIHSIVKCCKRFSGQLAERKKCDGIKDKLSKDIYTLFSYGEGSLPAIPKNMLRNESKQYVDNTCQTNVHDESFVLKKDLDKVKRDLLEKINAIQSSLLNASSSALSSADTVDTVNSLQPNVVPVPSTVSENNSEPSNPTSNVPVDKRVTDVNHSINHSTEKIIFVGDSILHRMNHKKMKVGNVPSIKLTKPGDNLDGCVNRAGSFVSKNAGDSLHIVLLAATNDLSRRKTQPINLMDNLIESLDELKKFTNVKSIFVCKLPPRSDMSRVNQKVYEFNQLLLDKFSNSDFVSVIDTVPPERRLFYKDGIHLSDFGLVKVCGILLSNL